MIRSINGNELHPDRGTWENFLKTCELRDECDGVRFYGVTNCNYIVFPTGELVENYGYHGRALMNRIRDQGWRKVLAAIKRDTQTLKSLIK